MIFKSTVSVSSLPVSLEEFRLRALAWANQFSLVAYYTSNNIPYPYQGFKHMLAVSDGPALPIDETSALSSFRTIIQRTPDYYCGFFNYDLKNQIETLSSKNHDHIGFPLIFFFRPEVTIFFDSAESISIASSVDSIAAIIDAILLTPAPFAKGNQSVQVKQRVNPTTYKATVERIKNHILEGDVYELNYCIEFYAEQAVVTPLDLFLALNTTSPTPFAGYLKAEDKYLVCASPERFLKKEGRKLTSQPIKGTIRRGATPEEDVLLQQQLRNSEKELAENMMIVDLVRNDLRKSCSTGTVRVEEMFGIYGFKQVSQMISTITGELQPGKDLTDALRGAFPMGSMTGAPKIRAMELIEEIENTKRGLYAGAYGYLTPEQDADFNVVIRSIQYNASTQYLSFMVGSAITYDSDPEQEYQECLLKAQAILKVLGQG
ncbi:anthranilate synthase component I family protein [Pontibacter sp. SGAir0037]|uniref:anthranilate synthase component I family protein n=1 Tax=Pontibacter sp. SGAir0037 TaxID=2571030 RepID=UPI0010CCF1BA|nr:anthranilate synthase component I family protein [Pontibacter sp. SGAir0037]QCR22139.1 para-aminobenzoate synthase [Pontibacter sp. SGAir0037]